jgi:hypothetical protein
VIWGKTVHVTLFAALWLSGAGRALAQADCTARTPANAAPSDAHDPGVLLGTWDIQLIDTAGRTQPARYRQLRLVLERPDSVQRRFWPRVSLVGRLAAALIAPVHRPVDPTRRPDIALAGDLLQLGGFGILDGPGGDVLRLTGSTGEGFWGLWQHSRGFEVLVLMTDSGPEPVEDVTPQGYFCAQRVMPGR